MSIIRSEERCRKSRVLPENPRARKRILLFGLPTTLGKIPHHHQPHSTRIHDRFGATPHYTTLQHQLLLTIQHQPKRRFPILYFLSHFPGLPLVGSNQSGKTTFQTHSCQVVTAERRRAARWGEPLLYLSISQSIVWNWKSFRETVDSYGETEQQQDRRKRRQ